MFVSLFYELKRAGIPVSPTSFLRFQKALDRGLVYSMEDLYITARSVLVKSERFFDLYDQVFCYLFDGGELPDDGDLEKDFWAHALLQEWLENPKKLANALGEKEEVLNEMSRDELLDYFKKRLAEQKGRHDGGSKWIGTGGTSPVGHSGYHPGGMRVGGISSHKSALQVAGERRYQSYSGKGPLTRGSIGDAMSRLRNLVPRGSKDVLSVDKTIRQTIKNGGEIEIVFDHALVDRLKIILAIDNGGWSMEPYVCLVKALFDYSRAQFKDLKICFFHNTIYDCLWEDEQRFRKPLRIDDFSRYDPDTRLIIVGDASMAPYELMVPDGSIHAFERSGKPSIERLGFLAETFEHSVWLNPVARHAWDYTHTIRTIRQIFPMFELSLEGLEKATAHLMQ
ncbi:MAG: hypothetical protein D6B25_12455 [Desulfobulbaceae bacterium]|nr:MAG: hypothetical protein D6B25_12455 [Desulfobulbaceae bacterium]